MLAFNSNNRRQAVRTFGQAAFWSAGLAVLASTLLPVTVGVEKFVSDKLLHAIAFFLLAGLGLLVWEYRLWLRLIIGLVLLGAFIEVLQSSPMIGRDAEVYDWFADIAGVLTAYLAILSLKLLWARPAENRP